MTREEAKQLLPILQAFTESRTIQHKDYDMNGGFEWKDLKKIEEWDWHDEYRIKPEPTYRPFKNAEECWQEMQKHQPFGWVKTKANGSYILITSIQKEWTYTEIKKTYESDFDMFIFADGQPFGILESD